MLSPRPERRRQAADDSRLAACAPRSYERLPEGLRLFYLAKSLEFFARSWLTKPELVEESSTRGSLSPFSEQQSQD